MLLRAGLSLLVKQAPTHFVVVLFVFISVSISVHILLIPGNFDAHDSYL